MRKYKKVFGIVIFLAIFVLINSILQFILVPSGIVRVIIHELDKGDYKCVFLGTSHGSYGIDSATVSSESGINSTSLCMGGEYIQDSYYLLKRVFETNTPDVIVYDMDFEYLVNMQKNSVSGSSIFNSYPLSMDKVLFFKDKILSLDYRAAFFPWMDYRYNSDNIKSIVKQKMTSAYWNYSAEAVDMKPNNKYMGRGFMYRIRTANNEKVGHMKWDESRVDKKSLYYFQKMVDLCNKHNTKLIMISTPVPVEKIKYTTEQFEAAYAYLDKLAATNNIEYYNFNLVKQSLFSRTKDDYNDFDGHMYGDAAQRFSVVLGQFMKDLSDGQVVKSDYFYDSVWNLE